MLALFAPLSGQAVAASYLDAAAPEWSEASRLLHDPDLTVEQLKEARRLLNRLEGACAAARNELDRGKRPLVQP